MARTAAQAIRCVKLALPSRLRRRWPLMMRRFDSSILAGTSRKLVAVGTPRLASMLLTIAAAAPRSASPGSGSGSAAGASAAGAGADGAGADGAGTAAAGVEAGAGAAGAGAAGAGGGVAAAGAGATGSAEPLLLALVAAALVPLAGASPLPVAKNVSESSSRRAGSRSN